MRRSMMMSVPLFTVLLASCTDRLAWTEDVRLPDGRNIRLERQAEFEGPSQTESMQRIAFTNPVTKTEVVWEARGIERRVALIAVWIDHARPTLLVTPLYASDHWQFGCPNPPYLGYQHVAGDWRGVPLSSLPDMTIRSNVTGRPAAEPERIVASGRYLAASQTAASVFFVDGVRPVPYVIHLGPQVVQTQQEANCDRELDYLVKEE